MDRAFQSPRRKARGSSFYLNGVGFYSNGAGHTRQDRQGQLEPEELAGFRAIIVAQSRERLATSEVTSKPTIEGHRKRSRLAGFWRSQVQLQL